jgi:hypothetical protein
MIIRKLTGHSHRGSASETSDSCGNCTGARCDYCITLYSWYGYEDKWFENESDAIDYGKEESAKRMNLVPNVAEHHLSNVMWILNDNNELYAHYFGETKHEMTKCNEDSPLYYDLWSKAVNQRDLYNKCNISDKGQNYHISYCQKFNMCCMDIAKRCHIIGCYGC